MSRWRPHWRNATRILAPMIDASEAAWRHLARRHGAELCYTPMLYAKSCGPGKFMARAIADAAADVADGPLIAQLAGDDAGAMLAAGRQLEPWVAAIDVNLGCPQHVARRGNYGAWLMDQGSLVSSLVSTLASGLSVPVTCKIRIFPGDVPRTIAWAQRLVDAGAAAVAVHGRGRDQRGTATGAADWTMVAAIRAALPAAVPVWANGGILFGDDLDRCRRETGANGVMVAESHLTNPHMLASASLDLPFVWTVAAEYRAIVSASPVPTSLTSVRTHVFALYHAALTVHPTFRGRLGAASTSAQVWTIVDELDACLQTDAARGLNAACAGGGSTAMAATWLNHSQVLRAGSWPPPHWLCQPRVRDFDLLRRSYPK